MRQSAERDIAICVWAKKQAAQLWGLTEQELAEVQRSLREPGGTGNAEEQEPAGPT